MISFLEGKIDLKTDRFVAIDVGGVGYKVFASPQTLGNLPQKGESVKIFTFLYSREDTIELYGFLTPEEMEFFEILNAISGIGPKSALGVLSVASVKDLKSAIINEKPELLTKVSGIGKRTAERIILELKNKFKDFKLEGRDFTLDSDAIDALVGLGYSVSEAREALKKVSENVEKIEDRVKEALKLLGRR